MRPFSGDALCPGLPWPALRPPPANATHLSNLLAQLTSNEACDPTTASCLPAIHLVLT